MRVSYTGSFSDTGLMSKQATNYLAAKVDVLTGSSQSVVGAITVAKAQNIAWFGTQWTQVSLAPKQVVSSQIYDWNGTLNKIFTGLKAGKLGGGSVHAVAEERRREDRVQSAVRALRQP